LFVIINYIIMYKYIILLLLLFSVVNNNNCIFLIQSYTFFSITNLIFEIMEILYDVDDTDGAFEVQKTKRGGGLVLDKDG